MTGLLAFTFISTEKVSFFHLFGYTEDLRGEKEGEFFTHRIRADSVLVGSQSERTISHLITWQWGANQSA